MHFGQKYHRNDAESSADYTKKFMMSLCLITGDVYLSHLVKLMSAGLPNYRVSIFPFHIQFKYIRKILWDYTRPITLQMFYVCLLIVASTGGSIFIIVAPS